MLWDASLVPLKGLMHLHMGAGTFWPLFGEGLLMLMASFSLDLSGQGPSHSNSISGHPPRMRQGTLGVTHTRSLAAVAKESTATRARRVDLMMVAFEV